MTPDDAGRPRQEVLPRIDVEATAAAEVEAARARLNETAGAVGVVDAERYKEQRASTLADALGYAAGVFVQPRFGSEESRLSVRGSGLQRTFHLRGLELMQDGVYLNQADGGGDFQAVEPLAARYIEVYRGANALQYGAPTLGGAVNFVSPTGRSATAIDLRLEGGSFGYARGPGGMEAHLGTAVAGFPNFFLLIGPNTGLGHSSVILMIEAQIDYALQGIQMMLDEGVQKLEVRAEVQDKYNVWLQKRMSRTVWQRGGCVSYYNTSTGKNTTLWPGFTFEFMAHTRNFDRNDYVMAKQRGGGKTRGALQLMRSLTSLARGAATRVDGRKKNVTSDAAE